MTVRNHPVAFSTLLCAAALLIFASFLPWACTPGGPSNGCLTSADCPAGQLCIGTNCLGKVARDATPPADQPPADQGPQDTTPQPEPPPETPDQPTPEAPSDATQGDVTPDTPVCRLDELRTCQHGCGTGTQRCIVDANGAAAWAPCKPKETKQSCYSGSANTVGVGLCKAGTQICDGEKWGPCEGEIPPAQEVCGDGKDNDCNGKTDESEAGCQCKPNDTQACGSDVGECQKGTQTCSEDGKWGPCAGEVAPQMEACDGKDNDCDGMTDNVATLGSRCTIMGKLGPCAEGKQACVQNQLICQQTTMPAKETCDGVDNDCDGSIDNNIAGVGAACTLQGQQGECAKGITRCQSSGTIACITNASPTTEVCRDGKDNDCDGMVDEICGAKVQMAIVNGNGTVAYKTAGIAGITRTAAGTYDITTKDTCGTMYPFAGKVPMFVVPRSSTPRSSGYVCDEQTGKYKLVIGGNGLANTPFYVAFPSKRSDEAYGSVSFSCAMGGACSIHYAQRGNATIQRTASGTYDINSSFCKSANQPYFAQAYMNSVGSYVTMAFVSPGKCRVYTFASNGALNNAISFSYWIPSPTAMAWASIDANGKVVAANIFGDQRAKWTAKINRTMGSFASMDVEYSGWNKNTVPMITPGTSGKYGVTAGSKSGGFLTYPFTLPSTPRALPRMSIMFLQP